MRVRLALLRRAKQFMNSTETSAPGSLPEAAWFARASKPMILVFALLIGAVVFGINLALDFSLAHVAHSPLTGYLVSDGAAAAIAVFLVLNVIRSANERRVAVRRRLELIAAMNHHVRNSLDAIQMSAQLTRDRDAIKIISDEVSRIEWALREILAGGPKR